MLSIQFEDNMSDTIEVLDTVAIDEESAYALMLIRAEVWIREFCPDGFKAETVPRPRGLDIVVGLQTVASYTSYKVNAVFSVHGEFGLEVTKL